MAEKRVDYTYDAVGQYATITTYADLAATDLVSTATHTFNALHELTGLVYTKGATTLASYSYTYDSAGSMLSMTTVDGTTTYTNDDAGQLTAVDSTIDESYTYDDNGNRVTANSATYVTGDDNQLLSDGTYRYVYDAEGNRTARFVDANTNGVLDSGDTDITTYTWDYRNRLTAVSTFDDYADYTAGTSSSVVSYTYDYANRLIGRTFDADGSAGTGDIRQTVYSYDGDQIALQFDKTYANGSASDLTATDLSHRYVWDSQAVDHLFADEDVGDAEVLYALTDHLGSVRDLAVYDSQNDATTIANHRVYGAYGTVQSESNSAVDCLFGYTGRLFDDASGLQNNLNRWYDANSGRWMSQDPIGFAAGDANVYRYCDNTPINLLDSNGLEPNRTDAIALARLLDEVRRIEKEYPNETPYQHLCRLRDSIKGERSSTSGGSGSLGSPPAQEACLGWKYIYTKEAGWIDLAHFFESARFTCRVTGPVTVTFGYALECRQMLWGIFWYPMEGEGSSAWSREDGPSNRYGAGFGQGLKPDVPLSKQIEDYFERLGAKDPKDAPDYSTLPKSEKDHEKQFQKTMSDLWINVPLAH